MVPLYFCSFILRIKALLHHYAKECADHMTGHVTNLGIPWDQVILACVEHMLGHMSSDQWVSCLHGNELKFTIPGVWLHAQAETSVSLAAMATRTTGSKRRRYPSGKLKLMLKLLASWKFSLIKIFVYCLFLFVALAVRKCSVIGQRSMLKNFVVIGY